jgi:hypothetical protein
LHGKKKQFLFLKKYKEEKGTGELGFHNRRSALETANDWCPRPAYPRWAVGIPRFYITVFSPNRC